MTFSKKRKKERFQGVALHGLTALLRNGLLSCTLCRGGLINTFSFDERAGALDDGGGQGGGGERGFHVDGVILGGQSSHCCWEPNWRGREGGKDLVM